MKPASRAEKPTTRIATLVAERQVQNARDLVSLVAILDGVAVERDVGIEPRRVRLVRDVAQRAGLGARAVQRALRPGQRLDALDVDDADLGLKRTLRQWLLVEVDGSGRVGDEGRGVVRHAAEVDRAATRRHRVVAEARHESREVLDTVEVGALELLLAYRLDFLRDVEQGFFAFAGRDDHGFKVRALGLRQYGRGVIAGQRDGNGVSDPGGRELDVRLRAHAFPTYGVPNSLRIDQVHCPGQTPAKPAAGFR